MCTTSPARLCVQFLFSAFEQMLSNPLLVERFTKFVDGRYSSIALQIAGSMIAIVVRCSLDRLVAMDYPKIAIEVRLVI